MPTVDNPPYLYKETLRKHRLDEHRKASTYLTGYDFVDGRYQKVGTYQIEEKPKPTFFNRVLIALRLLQP